MKPFYDDGKGIVIYHGDANDIVHHLADGSISLVLTDPPYGIEGEQHCKGRNCVIKKKNDYGTFLDSIQYVQLNVIPLIFKCVEWFPRVILTPGNKCLTLYPRPDSFGCFYQPASIGLQPWGRSDSQPIFYYGKYPRDSRQIPGQNLSFTLTESPPDLGHPCSKPIKAWTKLLAIGSNDGETILDPFMGSGTTLRAAKDLGIKAIGVEIEERYCEIAAKRLAQEVLCFT